jgi:hypothetical protein
MNIGNRVYYYINKALKDPILARKSGGISYHRLTGKIIRIFPPGKQLSANEIEELFNIMPGDPKFRKFYATRTNQKRAVMQTIEGVCYLFLETMWTTNTFGDDRYVEVVPNSVDFLFGED